MTITKDLLLYFIRDRKLDEQSEITQKQEFSGIQHWIADVRKLKREYLYLCDGNRVPDIEEKLDKDICLLVIFPNDQDTEIRQNMIRKWKAFHENLIFMQTEKTVPEVMNDLVEIFCRLVEWDKNMHIAALEGKDVQDLIDISEEILEHPMIAFDASFDVLAYTRHSSSHYKIFQETVAQGYTDAHTMEQLKKKQIFSQIKEGELLIAPAADEKSGTNIYLQFFSGQTLLGYTSIFCGEETPESGYLDLIHMFMKNMSFCLQRNYENQRHGRMMYETFLANLLGTAEIPEDRITEQVNMIDGLEETGYFVLGILDFSNQENVPLKFLARLLERQSWEIKPFLYEKHICLLKYSKVPLHQEIFFNEKELGILRQLLEQYQYRVGISNIFYELRCLRDAYTQAVFTLAWNKNVSQKTKEQVIYQYKDVVMYHLFSRMEDEMNPRAMQSEFYREVAKYDREHHSAYGKTVLCYLKNDCSATRTAVELGIHRNTVRNVIQSVEENYGISLDDAEEKMRYILSMQIEQYILTSGKKNG